MRRFRRPLIFSLCLAALIATEIQAQTSDPNRIAPVYVDDWFNDRILWLSLIGGLFGLFDAGFWLPRKLLPTPHGDDIRRGVRHFWYALAVAFVLCLAIVLVDISYVHRFGNRSHTFLDTVIQVGLSWRTFLLLLASSASFLVVVAVWTRLSNKCYRYMLVRR